MGFLLVNLICLWPAKHLLFQMQPSSRLSWRPLNRGSQRCNFFHHLNELFRTKIVNKWILLILLHIFCFKLFFVKQDSLRTINGLQTTRKHCFKVVCVRKEGNPYCRQSMPSHCFRRWPGALRKKTPQFVSCLEKQVFLRRQYQKVTLFLKMAKFPCVKTV